MYHSSFRKQSLASPRHDLASYKKHIEVNNKNNPDSVLPFMIDHCHMGYIEKEFANFLSQNYEGDFILGPNQISLSEKIAGFDKRTAFFESLLSELYCKNLIEKPRDEFYAVAPHFGDPPLFKIKRGASAYFGFKNYGIHLNAYVKKNDDIYIWVATRDASKQVAPLKLDQMVAGGQPYGLTVYENLVKEAAEEANLDKVDVARAVPTGTLRYCRQTQHKYRRDYIFVHDLEVPESFIPQNTDGEVASFKLLSVDDVISHLSAPDDFKFNSALVMIDFFIRHGLISPDEPGYVELTEQLYC